MTVLALLLALYFAPGVFLWIYAWRELYEQAEDGTAYWLATLHLIFRWPIMIIEAREK